MELYRYIIDDFLIGCCRNLRSKDFIIKIESIGSKKKGKREYINDVETKGFTRKTNEYFETYVEIPRIKVGQRQTIETLINEEILVFAKYLREEVKIWSPRIASKL